MDFKGRLPPAPAYLSCMARQPQVPIPFPTVCCPMQECCLQRALSSLLRGLLVEFHFFGVG